MARVLFHIDLNAFFASAEELRHPEYKGKPLAVGSLQSRGVLSTANYEARKLGIHSAMPTKQALSIYPDLIVVNGDYEYYKNLSSRFFSYLRTYSGMLEPVSIDECYLDVTEVIKTYKRPLDLAVQIQQGVLKETGLGCSIGVGPNKFLAKMASDMRKPMGITVLRKSEIPSKLWPLPVTDMIGVGKKTAARLNELGIMRIGDLADAANEDVILKALKKSGHSLIEKARGNSSDKLDFSTTQKSVSVSRTYASDVYSLEEALSKISDLARAASSRLKKEKQKGKLVSVVLRDTGFRNEVHSMSLSEYTDAYPAIYEAASNLVQEYFEPAGYRHFGLSVGSLKNADKIILQPTIFEKPVQSADDVIASLNSRLDGSFFVKASSLLKKEDDENEKSET